MKKNRKEIGTIRHGYKVMPCNDVTDCEAPVSWCQSCNLCLDHNLHYEVIGDDGLTVTEREKRLAPIKKQPFLHRYRKDICFVLALLFLLMFPLSEYIKGATVDTLHLISGIFCFVCAILYMQYRIEDKNKT